MDKKKLRYALEALVVLVLLCVSLYGLFYSESETRTDFLMDTFVTQQVTGRHAKKTAEEAFLLLRNFDERLSLYNAHSEIDAVNAAAGVAYVHVSDDTYTLLRRSQELSALSHQAFDFTIAPLTMLWHDAKEAGKPPTQEAVNEKLKLVNYNNVAFREEDKSVMLLSKNMALDIGGIAKGYACDLLRELYQKADIETALLSIGGNVYTLRAPRGEDTYSIGVRNPEGEATDPLLSLHITEKVVATSGAYERFFEYNGVSYHHILDKTTGFPVQSDLYSATIVANDGLLADFLSTTMFVLGKDGVLKELEREKQLLAQGKEPEFAIVAVDKERNVYVSPALLPYTELFLKQFHLVEN